MRGDMASWAERSVVQYCQHRLRTTQYGKIKNIKKKIRKKKNQCPVQSCCITFVSDSFAR